MAIAWNQVFNEAVPNQVQYIWPKRAEQLRKFSRDLGGELQHRQITNLRSGFPYNLDAVQAPLAAPSMSAQPAPAPHAPTLVHMPHPPDCPGQSSIDEPQATSQSPHPAEFAQQPQNPSCNALGAAIAS